MDYKSLKRSVYVGNVCLFLLRLNVQDNNVSVISGRNHRIPEHYQYIRGLKCLAQEHNTAKVGFDPPTSHSGARRSTTEPPCSPTLECGGSFGAGVRGWIAKQTAKLRMWLFRAIVKSHISL